MFAFSDTFEGGTDYTLQLEQTWVIGNLCKQDPEAC